MTHPVDSYSTVYQAEWPKIYSGCHQTCLQAGELHLASRIRSKCVPMGWTHRLQRNRE
uniref:Putative RNA methyltransferase At5g51130 n=1 Tax=Rhizophora mucronata TaxID=61149 RepID=A0A2P2K2R6_RHIMU